LDRKSQILEATDKAMDLLGFGAIVEVIGAKVFVEGSILEHVIGGRQD